MNPQEIWDLPINDIADDNCILFIWVTYPKLIEGIETISKWGFTYKTCAFSWVKKNKKADSLFWGLGYWTRANNEICLLATKGKPKRVSKGVHQVVLDKIREHSRKPEQTYERIEKLVEGPYLELFARKTKKNWDSWGDQVGLFDNKKEEVKTRKRPSKWIEPRQQLKLIS